MTKYAIVTWAASALVLTVSAAAADTDEAKRAGKVERLLAEAQKICPVSGKDLNSMGGPIRAQVDGQRVFLCCRGCVGRPLNREHWATVQSNLQMIHLALAQRICPVMGKDLLSMGGPVRAGVQGQTLFLCCKSCSKGPVQEEHWNEIQANLKAAQKVCPVRDVELSDEAVPVLVVKRVVFVCCDSGYCIKQVQNDPEKYLPMVDAQLAKSTLQAASRK